MSEKSLSSKIRAVALSFTILAGTGLTTACAEADSEATNGQATVAAAEKSQAVNGAALTRKYSQDDLRDKYETWTVDAPEKAEKVMAKARSLGEDTPFARWMEPKNIYKAPWGKGVTLRDVDKRNENEMKDGNMLAVVAVIVPPGSVETEWFQETDQAKRVKEVQLAMALNNGATAKENGGLIEFVYMVQQPEDQPIVVDGLKFSSKDAIVIMFGDQLPSVQYTPDAAASTAYAMFHRGMHKSPPFFYPSPTQLTSEHSSVGGDTAGGAGQGDGEPQFAVLDR